MIEARKISSQEAWDSATVFFVDEVLEDEIDAQVNALMETARDPRISETASILVNDIADFLSETDNALNVILKDIDLSEEKFKRVVSLLRRTGQIAGGFDQEWGIGKIKSQIQNVPHFAHHIAQLLVDGKRDGDLIEIIPRYYLETLNYREINGASQAARKIRYKNSLIGTYGGRKGHRVEDNIAERLSDIEARHGIGYNKGRSHFIDTNIDFAVPDVDDPWVIIMSSFQETTSSGQTTKAKDMLSAFDRIRHINSRNNENRAFVNFADGGGWLARRRDYERLIEQCHYFLNLRHLDMLEAIVLKHVPI